MKLLCLNCKGGEGISIVYWQAERTPAMKIWRRPIVSLLAVGALTIGAHTTADAQDFYRGKTITYNIATATGGSWDVYLRVVIKHLTRHIPGNPSIVLQYMPGAGGARALNYSYEVAPRDGTYIATPLPTSLLFAQLDPATVAAKPRDFQWIGRFAKTQDVIFVWHGANIASLDDAKKSSINMGVSGVASNLFFDIMMANRFLGTQFKPVLGYQGTAEIDLAIERGELEGRAGPWDGLVATKAGWLNDKKLNVLAQIGIDKLPALADVPLLSDLVSDKKDKAAAELISAYYTVGRVIYTPPRVPSERVNELRAAFMAAMSDPAYERDVQTAKLSSGEAMSGDALQALLTKIFSADPDTIVLAKKAIATDKN
jgi:tripartite-type tricarboxylate transporter receptor subunit TctC